MAENIISIGRVELHIIKKSSTSVFSAEHRQGDRAVGTSLFGSPEFHQSWQDLNPQVPNAVFDKLGQGYGRRDM